jgi:hypothetical protein
MSIPGAIASIIDVLEAEHLNTSNSGERYTFKAVNTEDITEFSEHVTLFLYRVVVDPSRRHIELPPAQFGESPRQALALQLHLLLTVWGATNDDGRSLEVLQECLESLDKHAIIPTLGTSPHAGVSLKVTIESLSNEDMMRIWDSLDVSYRMSVPLVARTIRTKAHPVDRSAPVTSRTLVAGQGRSQ